MTNLPEVLGELSGSFVFALIIYSIFKWLIYDKIKNLFSLLITFTIPAIITYLLFSIASDSMYLHIHFIALLALVDLIKLVKANNKEVFK